MTMDNDRVREYVAGLPDASGTFTGTFDPAEVDLDALLGPVPDLMPITVDTGDQPTSSEEVLVNAIIDRNAARDHDARREWR